MKRLLLSAVAVLSLSGIGFSQMMGGMMGKPQMMMPMMGCMGCGMMQMMGMGMMPMMGMMMDPETMKVMQEHMIKCRKELMEKLAKKHSLMAERMIRMMVMHPEAFKEAIKKNPELKKKLEELLK